MTDIQVLDCLQPELVTLERVNYFPRQLLTVDDMVTERDYMLQKLRRHNRYLHGWGVVCGLQVTAAPTTDKPWQVRIDGGYALGPYGDEIHVVEPVLLDLATCGPDSMTDPCDPGRLRAAPGGVGAKVFVAIEYAECLARPVKAMPAGCGCDDDPCEYSRIRDSFRITCLSDVPPSHQPPRLPTICDVVGGKMVVPCPPCPDSPWVVLAAVTLPAVPATAVAEANIDNVSVRRVVFSTAMIQDQLIRCCCGDRPTPPPANADLQVKQDNAVVVVGNGRLVRFTIEVTNLGPSPAANVLLAVKTDPPLGTMGFEFAADPAWTVVPGGRLQRNLGTMAPGAAQTVAYAVAVREPAVHVFSSTATASSATNDPNPGNNESVSTRNV